MSRWVLLLFLLLTAAGAHAQDRMSFSKEDYNRIRSWLPVKKNSFSFEEVNDLVKQLGSKKGFESIKVLRRGEFLHLEAKETAGTQKMEILGNQALTTSQILTLLNPQNDPHIGKAEIEKNIAKVREKYDSIGMKKVDISFREYGDESETHYVVEINEGSMTNLTEIVVLSPNQYLNNHIKFSLRKLATKKIDKELVKEVETTVNEILVQNRVLNARIASISPIYSQDRTSAQLTITLETATTYEFVIYGNRYFSNGNIISSLNLDQNFLNYIKNSKLLSRNIETLYRQNGFAQVSIESETIFFEKMDKHILKFTIKEGPQIRIRNINVSGKISRSPDYYQDLFFEMLGAFNNPHFFVEENVTRAADKLVIALKDEGFLRAEKLSLDYKINKSGNADVFMQINENILTQIRTVKFVGLKNFTSNQLYDVIDLKPNSPLNLTKVANSFSALRTFYQQNGYLEMDILTTPEKLIGYVDNYEFADLIYELKEGPQIHIKDVKTRGNTFTKDKVILRELNLTPGQILTSEVVNDSVVFLERTQLFSRAQLNTSDEKTDVADRTVFIDVQEKSPGLFSSGLGMTNERSATLRSYLGLAYKNLWGTGRGISGRADLKYSLNKNIQYPENRIVLGYYEPYLYFSRLRSRVSLVHEEQVFFIDPVTDKVRIQSSNEINFLLEKQINRRLKLLWHFWDFANLTTFDKDNHSKRTKIEIGSLGPAVEWDRRDNVFVPRDGTYSSAQAEYATPTLGSTNDFDNYIDYVKLTAGHTVYTPLTASKKFGLVNEFRTGYLDNLSDKSQSGVPATRFFFIGGRSTLRGYDLRRSELVPSLKEICPGCTTLDDYKMTTSSHFFLIKSEVRFPLYGDIGGLIFYDGASVHIKGLELRDSYRDTAGFGARYITPLGAFTLEMGFKLDKKNASQFYNQESPFTIHISMGSF